MEYLIDTVLNDTLLILIIVIITIIVEMFHICVQLITISPEVFDHGHICSNFARDF